MTITLERLIKEVEALPALAPVPSKPRITVLSIVAELITEEETDIEQDCI